MIKRIVISLFFAWALGFPYAQAKMPHLLPYCIYRHYAVAGSAFMPLITNSEELLRQLDGMEMPFYVGYVKLERDPETRLVLSMDYSKKTDLHIYAMDYLLNKIVETKRVNRYSHIVKMHEDGFSSYLEFELSENGLKQIEYEVSPIGACPDEPVLTAADFEFENTCIFRPFANPPELCLDIEVKLKNDPLGRKSNATAG